MITGYKGFIVNKDGNLTGLHGYSYVCGNTHIYHDDLEVGKSGLHYCKELDDIFSYCSSVWAHHDSIKYVYGVVTVLGKTETRLDQSVTDKLRLDGMLNGCYKTDKARYYFKKGYLHRKDGPAVEPVLINGDIIYYQESLRHREGGPAMILADGTLAWFNKGMPLYGDWRRIQPVGQSKLPIFTFSMPPRAVK